jgi:hypothetical protein
MDFKICQSSVGMAVAVGAPTMTRDRESACCKGVDDDAVGGAGHDRELRIIAVQVHLHLFVTCPTKFYEFTLCHFDCVRRADDCAMPNSNVDGSLFSILCNGSAEKTYGDNGNGRQQAEDQFSSRCIHLQNSNSVVTGG